MFRNYIKITVRNLRKHKGYNFINVVGLALGIACCELIFFYVQHELFYDKIHEHGEQIYKVVLEHIGDSLLLNSWVNLCC